MFTTIHHQLKQLVKILLHVRASWIEIISATCTSNIIWVVSADFILSNLKQIEFLFIKPPTSCNVCSPKYTTLITKRNKNNLICCVLFFYFSCCCRDFVVNFITKVWIQFSHVFVSKYVNISDWVQHSVDNLYELDYLKVWIVKIIAICIGLTKLLQA